MLHAGNGTGSTGIQVKGTFAGSLKVRGYGGHSGISIRWLGWLGTRLLRNKHRYSDDNVNLWMT